MKINWKLRLRNRATLVSIAGSAVAFIYQILDALGVVPAVDSSAVIEIAGLCITGLCALGIVVDPTTAGLSDSQRALSYQEPRRDKE